MSRPGELVALTGGALMMTVITLAERTGQRELSEDPKLLLDQIGLRIIRRRQDLGLAQKDLAEAVDMLASNLSQIERGDRNVTIRTLCRIADALDTTVLELMGGAPR
jgi:ribosome-binding protein aMBF1 (putative translation factor)